MIEIITGKAVKQKSMFLDCMVSSNIESYIKNYHAKLCVINMDGDQLLLTYDADADACYHVSMFSQLILYPLNELKTTKSPFLKILIKFFTFIARYMSLNKAVIVQNYPLSINYYPTAVENSITDLTNFIKDHFPKQAIVFRHINTQDHGNLILQLQQCEYLLMSIFPIHVFNKKVLNYQIKNHYRRDYKLLKNTEYSFSYANTFSSSDFVRIVDLYNQLYVKKHSIYNADLTPEFFNKASELKFLDIVGLRNANGVIDAFIAFYDRKNISTAPFVGYDLTLPSKLGLYRLLTAFAIERAEKKGVPFNYSSGASEFKLNRGAIQYPAYTAVYTKGLPLHQRVFWKALSWAYNRIQPIFVRKHKL